MKKNCLICGDEFTFRPYMLKIGKGKYCGRICAAVGIAKTLTGRKQSVETREKRSRKLTGYVYPNVKIAYANRIGKNHWNWKGDSAVEKKDLTYRELKSSTRWVRWRKIIFERDDYTCQMCGGRCGTGFDGTVFLEPHHIFPVKWLIKNNFLKHIFNPNNGITLCRKCHMTTIRRKRICAKSKVERAVRLLMTNGIIH